MTRSLAADWRARTARAQKLIAAMVEDANRPLRVAEIVDAMRPLGFSVEDTKRAIWFEADPEVCGRVTISRNWTIIPDRRCVD